MDASKSEEYSLDTSFAIEDGHLSPDDNWDDWDSNFDDYEVPQLTRPGLSFVDMAPHNLPDPLPKAFQNARDSLQNCPEEFLVDTSSESQFIPLRLVEIGQNYVHLHLPQDQVRYAALSYCWGDNPCQTKKATHQEWILGRPIRGLPKTIQDAIYITRELGFRFLWVDCLCIIQDDEDDKATQIAAMTEIFQRAQITICASSASCSTEGFIQHARVSKVDPLDTRGWAFQERLLSSRILNFSSRGLLFEGTEKPSETLQKESAIVGLRYMFQNLRSEFHLLRGIPRFWRSLVEEYSGRNLSDPADKLPAISGIAKEFARFLGPSYDAGIWKTALPADLLWKCIDPKSRPAIQRAPSWSWASIEGSIRYHLAGEYSVFGSGSNEYSFNDREIVDEAATCTVVPMRTIAKYGKVLPGGRLFIRGQLKRAKWTKVHKFSTRFEEVEGTNVSHRLDVDVYWDTTEHVPEEVYLLNLCLLRYFYVENFARTRYFKPVRPIGLILTSDTGDDFKRVGLYHNRVNTQWFRDSEDRRVVIV